MTRAPSRTRISASAAPCPRAAYLNGQDIPVDGGFSSHGGAKSITDALAKAHPGTW